MTDYDREWVYVPGAVCICNLSQLALELKVWSSPRASELESSPRFVVSADVPTQENYLGTMLAHLNFKFSRIPSQRRQNVDGINTGVNSLNADGDGGVLSSEAVRVDKKRGACLSVQI